MKEKKGIQNFIEFKIIIFHYCLKSHSYSINYQELNNKDLIFLIFNILINET